MKKTLLAITLMASLFILVGAQASVGAHLDKANTDINNRESLQNGAKLFMNYCAGCHSIEFMRYNRMAKDLGIDDESVVNNLIFTNDKIASTITSSISKKDAKVWFGGTPPDLSLVARSKGVDWIYTYLRSFYKDDSRPFGVNNHLLKNASMPDVLWRLKEDKTTAEFDKEVRDITNFLDYVGEPVKLVRIDLGIKVLIFLFILLVFSYLLKKEYWKDVKYGKWKVKD